MMSWTRSLTVGALALCLSIACSTPAAGPSTPVDAQGGTEPAPASAPLGSVQVPRDGKRFDPPIARSQVPEGAYFCDMGDVHYARMTPGDGSCPVCGMKLSHESPAPPSEGETQAD